MQFFINNKENGLGIHSLKKSKLYKVSAIKVGHTLFPCFLLGNTRNFEAFFIKFGMYVYFWHTKIYSQKMFKNCPNWPNSENGLKFSYARKNPIFDQKTCPIQNRLFLG